MSIELLAKLRAEIAEAKAKLSEHGQEALQQAFLDLFTAYPEIRSIQWTQYTPHFNDGDPCHFSVNEFGLELYDEYKATMVDPKWDEYDCKIYHEGQQYFLLASNERACQINEALRNFANAVKDKDLFEDIFGDHKLVIATREGFTVCKHNHD